MTIIALDPVRHAHLCKALAPDLAYAALLDHAVIGLGEVALAAADYPLVLLKDAQTGRFHLSSLLGFGDSHNLFVLNGSWHATYLPETVLRYPFFLDQAAPFGLAIDEGSALLGRNGERLFNEDGTLTLATLAMQERIQNMMRERTAMTEFVDHIVGKRLVRPLRVHLAYDAGNQADIGGLYTIDQFALEALDGEALHLLNRQGYLAPMHVMIASLFQFNRLEQLHNAVPDRLPVRVVCQ